SRGGHPRAAPERGHPGRRADLGAAQGDWQLARRHHRVSAPHPLLPLPAGARGEGTSPAIRSGISEKRHHSRATLVSCLASQRDHVRLLEVSIQSFKSLKSVTLKPGPLSVFIGPNGAGKSNLCEALDFIGEMYRSGLDAAMLAHGGFGSVAYRAD